MHERYWWWYGSYGTVHCILCFLVRLNLDQVCEWVLFTVLLSTCTQYFANLCDVLL